MGPGMPVLESVAAELIMICANLDEQIERHEPLILFRGGHAIVYKGVLRANGVKVAIKTMRSLFDEKDIKASNIDGDRLIFRLIQIRTSALSLKPASGLNSATRILLHYSVSPPHSTPQYRWYLLGKKEEMLMTMSKIAWLIPVR